MAAPTKPVKQLTLRGQRTRNQLLDAARTVFERDGFAGARITDIADAAGVAHGTFYTYFDSKEEIFGELIAIVRDEMLTGSVETLIPEDELGTEPWQSVARANRRYLTAYQRNARLMVIWEQAATINEDFRDMLAASRQRFSERAVRAIVAQQSSGIADSRLDPEITAVALGAMVSRFAYIWFAGKQPFDFDVAVAQLTMIWCNAIGMQHSRL